MSTKRPIFYGWWVVLAAAVANGGQGIMFYGFGIIFPAILDQFGWSRALTSSVYSFQLAVNSFLMLVMGYLADRFSPRLLVGAGAVLMFIGYALSGLATNIWHLYLLFGVIVGAGASAMYIPPIIVVTRWFEDRKGLALGIAVSGIGIGGSLGSPFLNWLIQSYGWKTALPILGVVLAGFLSLASLILRGDPREMALLPYKRELGSRATETSVMGKVGLNEHWDSSKDVITEWTTLEAIRTRSFAILYLMLFLANGVLVGLMAHLFTYATENAVSSGIVSLSYSIIGVASIAAKVGSGALSDRIGRKPLFFLSFLFQGLAFLLLLPVPSGFMLCLFAGTFGIAYGGWPALFPAALSDFFGVKAMGKIYAVLTTNFFTCAICYPIFAGWIFDISGTYLYTFGVFSGLCFFGAAVSLLLGPPQRVHLRRG